MEPEDIEEVESEDGGYDYAEDIRDLIAAAYSDERPNPHHMTREAEDIFHLVADTTVLAGTEPVAHFYVNSTTGTPDWKPEFAEQLQSFLDDQYDRSDQTRFTKVQARLEELRQGAPLTAAEQDAYEEYYSYHGALSDYPVYYLYRLSAHLPELRDIAPEPHPDDDRYSIYFLGEYMVLGQMADLMEAAGPLRSPDEVISALLGDSDSPFSITPGGEVEFEPGWDDDLTGALKACYDARIAADKNA